MRLTKIALRFWITLTSVFSFLIGWVMLAHSPKPVQAQTIIASSPSRALPPIATLPPLAPLNLAGGASTNNALQVPQINVQAPPQSFVQAPIFNTGGS